MRKANACKGLEWCPGADLNHRHEDFQSTALPLSYPGTGRRNRLGSVGDSRAMEACPEGMRRCDGRQGRKPGTGSEKRLSGRTVARGIRLSPMR